MNPDDWIQYVATTLPTELRPNILNYLKTKNLIYLQLNLQFWPLIDSKKVKKRKFLLLDTVQLNMEKNHLDKNFQHGPSSTYLKVSNSYSRRAPFYQEHIQWSGT